ncbi:MAG: hypothetical protein C7B45_13820, partial [Sulfobacillus acidophilus]
MPEPLFLPMDFDDRIPPHHVVRVVNAAVNRLDDALFVDVYPGGGRSPYHPKWMAKILVSAYTQRIDSSRPMAKAGAPQNCDHAAMRLWTGTSWAQGCCAQRLSQRW